MPTLQNDGDGFVTIQTGTAEDIRKAMQRFDSESRNTPDWHGWKEKKNHKFAFSENGHHYPIKEIISMATGTSKDNFNGGEESIRFASKLGFDVEALRLPAEPEVRAALHDLLLGRFPDPISPAESYEALAGTFHLSRALRTVALQSDGRNHWENRVQWARQQLVTGDILDPQERGVWKLKTHRAQRLTVSNQVKTNSIERPGSLLPTEPAY